MLIRMDPARVLRFAPLAGETARTLNIPDEPGGGTAVYRDAQGTVWRLSDAPLRALRDTASLWSWTAWLGWWVPRPVRDAVYRWIAKRRRGLVTTCVPLPEGRVLA
ncbi:hypothetical protein Pan265_27720 [Mucisphaera calidilacus]|uniref:DUF393 domain-containing protein n=2 Tax=Mucisphaera calidilacus TaxID=2527982 RepID=A0A518C0Z3_9BACT|nr:hypothetical protein Pan265_27720 [Mucisphaera calidilacus]